MKDVPIVIALSLFIAACTSSNAGTDRARTRAETVYYADFVAPCGRSLFRIARTPAGPFEEVQPAGKVDPVSELRYSVLVATGLKIHGYKTGKVIDDKHCGSYPEFVITRYGPWKTVVRPFLPDAEDVSGALFSAYSEGLPADRFVPQDFDRGTRFLDTESCVKKSAACLPATVQQTATDESRTVYCCRFAQEKR